MNRVSGTDLERIRECLRLHDGVEQVAVVEEETRPGPNCLAAFVVPNRTHAGPVRRACQLEAAGDLGPLTLYEPTEDLLVAQLNKSETDFLFEEIFQDRVYFRHGIGLRAEACVIDVGANVGMFSVYVSRHSPGARILAVEPVQELCRAVSANAHIHNANVKVINCALGKAAARGEFTYYPHNTVMSTQFADEAEDHGTLRAFLQTKGHVEDAVLLDRLVAERLTARQQECEIIPLSQLVDQEAIDRIDLLKIDTEKAELDVLAGMRLDTWAKVRQVVIEVHDVAGRVESVLELLRKQGFTVASERDHRLRDTNCFTVYGHRGERIGEEPVASVGAPTARWAGQKRLVADLLDHASRQLPAHLVPGRIVLVAALPMRAGQRIPSALAQESSGTADRDLTATEVLLVALTQQILNNVQIDIESNFFDFGGNSLSAIMLIARVENALGQGVLPPDTLFENGQLRQLAVRIDTRSRDGGNVSSP